MSSDFLVQDLPGNIRSIQDIPEDFEPGPVGKQFEIIEGIKGVIPFADFSEPSWGVIEGPEISVEVDLGHEEIVESFTFHIRGGKAAVGVVAEILASLRLQAIARETGDLFQPDQAIESLRQWHSYRDSILILDEEISLARRLCRQAERYFAQADYLSAQHFYSQSLATYNNVTGPVQLEIALCLYGLGKTMKELGDYAQAHIFLERALTLRVQVLGQAHPGIAALLQSLGEIVFDQGEFDAGQELIERALAARANVLGVEHPETLESRISLASVLAYRNRREEALESLEQTLRACERRWGENHILTAKALNALGVFWAADRDNRAKAQLFHERALAINEHLKGRDHPNTARSLNNLAALLADLGQTGDALQLLERSLAVHERVFGPKSSRLAFVLTNLADIYSSQQKYSIARSLLERSLILCERALGARHPLTVRSLRKLVAVLGHLQQQGDQEALLAGMPLHTILMSFEAAAGTLSPANSQMPGAHLDADQAAEKLHRFIARLEEERNRQPLSEVDQAELRLASELYQKAGSLFEEGDYSAAQSVLEQALAVQERVLGTDHLSHVDLLKLLARIEEAQGKYGAVLPLVQRVADIHLRVLGRDHPMTLRALSELMSRYSYEYGLDAALPLQEVILSAEEDMLGPDDPSVKMTRDSIRRLQSMVPQVEGAGDEPRRSRSERREQALAYLPPDREALLTGIELIDWHSLHHAYGPADDVPNLLSLLLSDDEAVREDAWEHLYGNVWHQGTVYEASAYVVPFFLKMLTYGGPPGKENLLDFLLCLAQGSSYLAVHARSDEQQTSWYEILAKQGRDFDAELHKELGWVEATNQAVSEGIPVYFNLLNHENAEVRRLSLALLASLRGRNADIVPRLQALLFSTQDIELKEAIVLALHDLMQADPQAQDIFTKIMHHGESEKIVFIAAVALTKRTRQHTPEDAVEILLNAVKELGRMQHDRGVSDEERAQGDSISARFDPAWGERGLQFVLGALTSLSPERGVIALLRALPMIQDGEEARETAGLILDLVFHDGQVQAKSTAQSWLALEKRMKVEYLSPKPQPTRPASSLTELQRDVLAVIAAHDPVWRDKHDLLKLYGLPITRDELRNFIG